MGVALGIFDVLTYAVPGVLYLALLLFVAHRLGWVDAGELEQVDTTLLVIGGAVASYLIGHAQYQTGRHADRVLGRRRRPGVVATARADFVRTTPRAAGRPFVQANPFVLLAAVEVRAPVAAVEISRLRATGLMLRNVMPVLFLATVVAAVEVVAGDNRPVALTCLVAFPPAGYALYREANKLREWAVTKTLQLAHAIPDIDELFGGDPTG